MARFFLYPAVQLQRIAATSRSATMVKEREMVPLEHATEKHLFLASGALCGNARIRNLRVFIRNSCSVAMFQFDRPRPYAQGEE
jgi:hypothetical protein